jgi:hypothetical protein
VDLIKNQIQNTLDIQADLVQSTQNEAELLHLIELYVQELVNSNFEKLLLILYRLDISEKKVKEAIDLGGPENASKQIATLILEREKEKVATREKYKNESTDWEF